MINNTYSDLIWLFIDGEATAQEKQLLFNEMESNSELRQEFEEALKLDDIMSSEYDEFVMQDNAKKSLLRRAGLGTSFHKKRIFNLSMPALLLYVFFPLAALSGVSLLYIYNSLSTVNESDNRLESHFNSFKNKDFSGIDYELPIALNGNLKHNHSKSLANAFYTGNRTSKSVGTKRQNLASTGNNQHNTDLVIHNDLSIQDKSLPLLRSPQAAVDQHVRANEYELLSLGHETKPGRSYSISLSYMPVLQNFSDPKIDRNSPVIYNDWELAVMINEGAFRYGVGLGVEFFPLWAKNARGDWDTQEVLEWYGAVAEWEINEIEISKFTPVINAALGYTVYGPYVKTGLDLEYPLMNELIFKAGFEGGLLIHRYNTIETTPKLNLSIGLRYII